VAKKLNKPESTAGLFLKISQSDNAWLPEAYSKHTVRKAWQELLKRGYTKKQLSDYSRGQIKTIPKPKNPPAKKGKK
jgi:hypothetical protein